jgi:hypothetical protein|tara:strand:- start:1897 stop:2049 length:153 start_codon:yes stop_codon:yes gene_type:complete
MPNRNVEITSEQLNELTIISEERGRAPIASLLRLAVAEFLAKHLEKNEES